MKSLMVWIYSVVALTVMAAPVWAQADVSNRVGANTDWSVFVQDNPTQCWVVSAPKDTVNTRDGRVVAARRGDIRLFVSYWPQSEKRAEVSFTGGYPFAELSRVEIEIGSEKFLLFTDGELAWADTPADDAKIVSAMKRGSEAVVSGVSSRGTKTRDTFSLLGFTASIEDAEARCG